MITVTLNEQLAVFPEASVATLRTLVIPEGKKDPEAGVDTTFTMQLSFTPTSKFTIAPQAFSSVLTIVSAIQIIFGASLSVTFILNEHSAVFPEASVAVEETRVVPTGKSEPDAGVDTTLTRQLSVAPTVKFTIAPQTPKSVLTARSAGQVITGDSKSLIIILKEQMDSLCVESIAE